MTRKQAEELAKLEDAVKWGLFEGEEPTPEPMRASQKFDPARPSEVERKARELSERIAAQRDEQTRNELHDFIVALTCNNNLDQAGMRPSALMRAMEPLEESENGQSRPPDPNHP